MKLHITTLLIAASLLTACGGKQKSASYDTMGESGLTTRTENLCANLLPYQQKGVLVGQAYGTTSAVGELSDTTRGDINKITGDLPACIGFRLDGIESDAEADPFGVPFGMIRGSIQTYFRRQGLVVLSWAAPKAAADKADLREPAAKVARFIGSLQDKVGIKVPVVLIVNPYGEGLWYDSLSPDDYKKLFVATTEELLADTLQNAVFAYSGTDDFGDVAEFMARVPEKGVSMVQLNILSDTAEGYGEALLAKAGGLSDACNERMLPLGVLGGVRGECPDDFFSSQILPTLQAVSLSYFMFGMNQGQPQDGNYYLPFAGHEGVADFMKIYNDNRTVFLRGLNGLLIDHSKRPQ